MYLFDTTALIGAVERGNDQTERLIESSGELPRCHLVTLGELEAGVARARENDASPDDVALRLRTLGFARRLPIHTLTDDTDVAVFGLVSALTSRRLSHDDQ
jgi:predicted nucleic acid-binding protein